MTKKKKQTRKNTTKIKAYLKARSMTQGALAEQAGVNKASVNYLCNGAGRSVSLHMLQKLADCLDLPLHDFAAMLPDLNSQGYEHFKAGQIAAGGLPEAPEGHKSPEGGSDDPETEISPPESVEGPVRVSDEELLRRLKEIAGE